MNSLVKSVAEAAQYLQGKIHQVPKVGLILGTGLGDLAEAIDAELNISYSEIPHFPISTVSFHAGRLVVGTLDNKTVIAMQGRFHYYEGYSMQQISLPIRVMRQLGVDVLIGTNAVGGIRATFRPGQILLVKDHINLMGDSPLIGPYDESLGERFPDMSEPYSLRLRKLAKNVANHLSIQVVEGVYAAVNGPSFETGAELKMLQTIGVDTVGMSLVPEILVARQMKLECLGINVITDVAVPETMVKVNHEDVSRVAGEVGPKLASLVKGIIAEI